MTDIAAPEASAHLVAKPSYMERKLARGARPDVIPSLPFHSASAAAFADAEEITIQVPLMVSLGELNKTHLTEMIRRMVLFRNPAVFTATAGSKRQRADSDSDSDDDNKAQTSLATPVISRSIVSISKIGAPQSHTQVKGKGGVATVKINVPVDVLVTTLTHGICPGIVREECPYPGATIVEVQCGGERVNVTCVCPEGEKVANGQTVLVAVEPTCLRVQIFRPSRVSRGKFQKTVDVRAGKTEITFTPDFDGDAKVREAAEAKTAASSQNE